MKKTLSLLLVFLLIFTSCGQKKPQHSSQRMIQIGMNSKPLSLDPRFGGDHASSQIVRMLFEGLMRYDQKGEIVPAIAKSYDLSEDAKTYTFHLRKSRWNNGIPLTAYDFEYSWKKAVDPKSSSQYAYNFYVLENAKQVAHGEKDVSELGVQALDDHTLQVRLRYPVPYFLELIASTLFMPVCKEVAEANPSWVHQQGTEFVCNGPYNLAKWNTTSGIQVKKNPRYWAISQVNNPGIDIHIIENDQTNLLLFEQEKIDWLGKPFSIIPLDAVSFLKEDPRYHLQPELGVVWYFFNTKRPFINNAKIRKAIAYAINRDKITNHLLQNKEMPATRLLPSSITKDAKPFFTDGNETLAKQLFAEGLEELGLTPGEVPTIKIHYTGVEINTKIAQVIQNQLKNTLNLPVELVQAEWKVHYENMTRGEYDIGSLSWFSPIHDPYYLLSTFKKANSSINLCKWEHPKYIELLRAAQLTADRQIRTQYLDEAEKILLEEMPVIPLYFSNLYYMKNPKLKNPIVLDVSEIDLSRAYIEE